MELPPLIDALSRPAAYPFPVDRVEVHHTHISVVFVAGPWAYKIKKPVDLGFLNFTTLENRHHFCAEEVRLNRRLAPTVYHGVVPVARTDSGIRLEAEGEVVEWAVKMERLPEEATLGEQLRRGAAGAEVFTALARRLAEFHARADAGPHVAAFGRFAVVAHNVGENYQQAAAQVGATLSLAVYDRLQELTEEALARFRSLLEARAERGVPRDTHGDLHLDHVYLFPDRPPPADLVVIDCIEFNERFRFADPVADMAFLVMDLLFHGRRDLAYAFTEAYFQAAGDGEGRALLPFYTAYRAAVRGKVEGFELAEREVPESEKAAARTRARGHWLLALGALETPGRRPCLVLAGGLPGTGKSTLARGLAERADFALVRSDVVRKELAGLPADRPTPADLREQLYAPEWTERTYAECLRRAGELLFEGKRVIIDANFREEQRRQAALAAAVSWGVPAVLLLCQADAEQVRARLQSRKGDASDADWDIHRQAAATWEELGPASRQACRVIVSSGSAEQTLAQALAVLRDSKLAE